VYFPQENQSPRLVWTSSFASTPQKHSGITGRGGGPASIIRDNQSICTYRVSRGPSIVSRGLFAMAAGIDGE